MGSILGPNRIIAKTLKVVPTAAMRDINSMSRGNALAPNRRYLVQCTVKLADQGHAIIGLVICDSWDLEP